LTKYSVTRAIGILKGRAIKGQAVIERGTVVKQGTWTGKRAASGRVVGCRLREDGDDGGRNKRRVSDSRP
jgi:hypothetical protein